MKENQITTKLLTLLIILLSSCKHNNLLPEDMKKGLISFNINKSQITQQIDSNGLQDLPFGALWIGFNMINTRTDQDTLIAEVNFFIDSTMDYDGGYKLQNDTMHLYAKYLGHLPAKETLYSTLTYKILMRGRTYKEIEFQKFE